MKHVLKIYLARHCFGTAEASILAAQVKVKSSDLEVKVIMLGETPEADLPSIPATPSYFLDDHLIFLGNPGLEELLSKIASRSKER